MIDHTFRPPVEPDVVPFRNNPRRTVICCSGWRLCTIPGPCHAEAWMLVRADISTLLHQCLAHLLPPPSLPAMIKFWLSFSTLREIQQVSITRSEPRTSQSVAVTPVLQLHLLCNLQQIAVASNVQYTTTAKLVSRTRHVLLCRERLKNAKLVLSKGKVTRARSGCLSI